MKNKLAILKSEILRDLDKLERLFEKFESAYTRYQKQNEYAYMVEAAFHINHIYTGCERMFNHIATAFENNIDDSAWHKSLLDRMVLNIENIRPAVIAESTFHHLNELRAFRHFFRHAYDIDLEDKKFAIVVSASTELKKEFHKDIHRFLQFIDQLLED